MFLLGRPLVRRVEEKAAGEAQLRYELTRVKDNARRRGFSEPNKLPRVVLTCSTEAAA